MKFAINETKEMRKKIEEDLERFVRTVYSISRDVTIGLAGSFSHGEGRVSKHNNKIEYLDDFDFFLITNSFYQYLELLKNKKNIMKKSGFKKCDIWVKWKPLVDLRISSITDYIVLNMNKDSIEFRDKWLNKETESLQYLQAAQRDFCRYIVTENRDFLEKSYIEVFRSLIFLKDSSCKNNYFKNNLKQLAAFKKEIDEKQHSAIKTALEFRLGISRKRSGLNSLTHMRKLYNRMFRVHYKRISIVTVKYYFKFIIFSLKRKKFVSLFQNHNRKRLIRSNNLINMKIRKNKEDIIREAKELIIIHELVL
ncbi:hypothetical protein ACFLTH_16520 [Bacteroidota bacterium]